MGICKIKVTYNVAINTNSQEEKCKSGPPKGVTWHVCVLCRKLRLVHWIL